jgi:hypothetical protein
MIKNMKYPVIKILGSNNNSIVYLFFYLFFSILLASCGSSVDVSGGDVICTTGGPSSSAVLSWDPPTTNADGSELTDLARYNVYYGPDINNYTMIPIGNVTTYTVNNLSSGTYYFVVTALDDSDNESEASNVACKIID